MTLLEMFATPPDHYFIFNRGPDTSPTLSSFSLSAGEKPGVVAFSINASVVLREWAKWLKIITGQTRGLRCAGDAVRVAAAIVAAGVDLGASVVGRFR